MEYDPTAQRKVSVSIQQKYIVDWRIIVILVEVCHELLATCNNTGTGKLIQVNNAQHIVVWSWCLGDLLTCAIWKTLVELRLVVCRYSLRVWPGGNPASTAEKPHSLLQRVPEFYRMPKVHHLTKSDPIWLAVQTCRRYVIFYIILLLGLQYML